MPDPFSAKDLLDLTEKLESRVNAYWNFYTVVVLAVAGWVVTKDVKFTTAQGYAAMAGLACFFAANFSMIRGATRLIVGANAEMRARADGLELASAQFRKVLRMDLLPGRLLVSWVLHAAVDAAILWSIWSRTGLADAETSSFLPFSWF